MIDLELSWRQAAVAAGGLMVASVALRATKRERLAAARETTGLIPTLVPAGTARRRERLAPTR